MANKMGAPKSGTRVEYPNNPDFENQRPFSQDWLNSCYQQTLLPDAPWHKMEHKIALGLAKKVSKQFKNPERKEALLESLGKMFVSSYLPDVEPNPQILKPPDMDPKEKAILMKEAEAYLTSQLYKCVREEGYGDMLASTDGKAPKGEYAEFLQQCFNVFHKGLDRELYIQELDLSRKKVKELQTDSQLRKMVKPSRVKPSTTSSSSSLSSTPSDKPNSAAIRTMVQKVEGDPPPLWGVQSDAIGQAVMAILERDPRKFDHVAGRMHGRQLPGTLRAHMWADVLFREERKRLSEGNLERVLRERFAKAVARGVQDLRITRATNTPIAGLIENAVVETYNKTTGMVAFRTTEHMIESSRTLNVLYTFDRSYEPYLIHWLFPLQVCFQQPSEKPKEKGQHVYELAMYLDLLNNSCFPTWIQVFAIAETVMNILSQTDPDMYTHLKAIATTHVKINKKEFLVQLISVEKAKAEELLKATPGSKREESMNSELLADPLIFLRRWIGEGFVSVLDTPGIMYVWDQCFLQGWQPSVLQNFAMAILMLLKHKFMKARDYTSMKEVFFFEPCKLYTVDIQMAWIHLESGKDLMEIPYLNRQRPVTPASRLSGGVSIASPTVPGFLPPFGMKDVSLKLVIPSTAVSKESWLNYLNAADLVLHVSIYFGSIKLRSRMSMHPAYTAVQTKDVYKNLLYEIHFPQDKFVYESIDISQYDVERELGAHPYALLRVEYKKPASKKSDAATVQLGWARVPLFYRDSLDGRTSTDSVDVQWTLQAGENKHSIHSGEVPDSLISTVPQTPKEKPEGLLGYSSELGAVVYEPKHEPKSKKKVEEVKIITPPPETPVEVEEVEEEKKEEEVIKTPDELLDPWVEYNPFASRKDPEPTGLNSRFDLYIDAVHFIPDNASIIKVTGIIGAPDMTKVLLALPDLKSSARSPRFVFRLEFNEEEKELNPQMVAFLRVYTYDIFAEEISVIGSVFVPIFNKGKLNVGGHQLRLRNGLPKNRARYKVTDLDQFKVVPASSILVRILPHEQEYIDAPRYGIGYYHSEPARPTITDERIFASYADHMNYPKTETHMIQRLQSSQGFPLGETDEELLGWLQAKLDIKKVGPKFTAGNLPLDAMVRYRIKQGLRVRVNRLWGLPPIDNLYTQCYCKIEPGEKVRGMPLTAEGHGGEERFLTNKIDFNSLMTDPKWNDDVRNLKPHYDTNSVLMIQIFGVTIKYKALADHNSAGIVRTLQGEDLVVTDDQILGWTAMPLFEANAVLTGVHELPVFRGKPPEGIIESFSIHPINEVIEKWKWDKKSLRIPWTSMTVTLWDGHYDFNDLPFLPTYEDLLKIAGNLEAYKKSRENPKGSKNVSSLVLEGLEGRYRRQGIEGEMYQKEKVFFQDLMNNTMSYLIEQYTTSDTKKYF
ncbi:uncharacterized protein LOC132545744 isoform X1 [Ylistrum balloti]|uniref:uncharacterized protein LOC132545744 isoform X1 n=1 Tax=Ylistrum balloti TaxID=509963 RepID=UPI002905A4F7|nr:uncharacterized protein LOC132545744 isoform X1 [Ylistrum balloti]